MEYDDNTDKLKICDVVKEYNLTTNGGKRYIQKTILTYNPVLHFGPMCTQISDLFNRGYRLEVVFPHYMLHENTKRRSALYLVGEEKRYCIRKLSWNVFIYNCMNRDLCSYVTNGKDFMAPQSPTTNNEIDPWDQIMKRYPTPKIKMIGNRTIREHFEDSLGLLP